MAGASTAGPPSAAGAMSWKPGHALGAGAAVTGGQRRSVLPPRGPLLERPGRRLRRRHPAGHPVVPLHDQGAPEARPSGVGLEHPTGAGRIAPRGPARCRVEAACISCSTAHILLVRFRPVTSRSPDPNGHNASHLDPLGAGREAHDSLPGTPRPDRHRERGPPLAFRRRVVPLLSVEPGAPVTAVLRQDEHHEHPRAAHAPVARRPIGGVAPDAPAPCAGQPDRAQFSGKALFFKEGA